VLGLDGEQLVLESGVNLHEGASFAVDRRLGDASDTNWRSHSRRLDGGRRSDGLLLDAEPDALGCAGEWWSRGARDSSA